MAHHTATRGFHNRMAIVFDFDRTLASGTFEALLETGSASGIGGAGGSTGCSR